MLGLPEEKVLYSEIQKKIFYIIPEEWDGIYLYTSIIDIPGGKPVGELFFYYVPKGFIKKKPVNCYEVPGLFDIDEEEYSELISDLYRLMKALRDNYFKKRGRTWSNATIIIKDYQFRVEYGFEKLENSEYDSYERHVIWRYKYLDIDLELFSRKDKKIIDRYFEDIHRKGELKKEIYTEGIYTLPIKNIIDYEKTLSVDEALAQSKAKAKKELKESRLQLNEKNDIINNQILNYSNKNVGKK